VARAGAHRLALDAVKAFLTSTLDLIGPRHRIGQKGVDAGPHHWGEIATRHDEL